MAIFETWKNRTAIVMRRSTHLKKLDDSIQSVVENGYGINDVNILQVSLDLDEWKEAQNAEVSRLNVAVSELENEINRVYWKGKSQLTNVISTGMSPVGWQCRMFNPNVETWTTALPNHERVNPNFSTAETMRLNEAIRRVKRSVMFSRDALLRIVDQKASGLENDAYSDFFGDFDIQRARKIRDNFRILALAFAGNVNIIDLRNTYYGKTCYAACFRNSLAVLNQGQLGITGNVEMYLGRLFFGNGNYEKTSADSIGTLVHEFAHGVINAVDVPPVDNTGAWTHARVSDDPNSNDFGASTDNNIQASTPDLCRLLAEYQPDYALVNADSYGEFATQLLIINHG